MNEIESLLKKTTFCINEITHQYLYDESPRPWIVGFSGGKDSTTVLQLVWYALLKIPRELHKRKIYVVCNDTMVENPQVANFVERCLDKIKNAAKEQSLPIHVYRTQPELANRFWVKLIGKGYPAPGKSFRWCTQSMKIEPTTKFILDKIKDENEVIILLGTRKSESKTRDESIKKYEVQNERLMNHVLKNAKVFAPISEWTTKEVWQYLASSPPPWGGKHHELIAMYKNASAGDCPVVLDTSTPSCGSSRFGCWVCTVVSKDKSMEYLSENEGYEWMNLLLEYRNFLAKTKRLKKKTKNYYAQKTNSIPRYGPYKPETRKKLLFNLIEIQEKIREHMPDATLISKEEILKIKEIWDLDEIEYDENKILELL